MRKNSIYTLLFTLFPFFGTTQTIVPNGAVAPQLPLPAIPSAYNADMKVNYVRTWEARKAVSDGSVNSLNNNINFKTGTAYFDGLGRPLQTVVKGNNYDGTKDVVSMNVYDEYGRETKQYLPYAPAGSNNGKFRLNPFAEQQAYYNTNNADQTPFSRTEFEASPLNRALKTMPEGNSWAGSSRGTTRVVAFNTGTDDVKIIAIGSNGTLPVFGSAYAAGELIKTVTTDEQGKQVIEYKDREEKTLLKKVQLTDVPGVAYTGWLCTYYIYDDFGQLRFVLQPKAVEQLVANGWNLSPDIKDELCFIYEYDANGRIVYKKVPGAAPVYMCYDKRDRLVYSQDGNLRIQNKWLVIFYDELNRPVSTALYNTTQTGTQLQSALDGLTTVNPVPTITENLLTRLTYSYYDEYNMAGTVAYNQGMVNTAQANISAGDEVMENLARTDLTRGMVTGTQTRVLGTTTMLNSTIYYDTKGRALQSHTGNYKGGTDVATMVYSFTGKLLSSYVVHNNPASLLPQTQTIQTFTKNTYNNDYLLKTEMKILNTGQNAANVPWQRIAEIQYNDMGKPKKKMMGGPESNFYVDVDYNIRGWVTGMNKTAQQNLENGAIGSTTFYDAIFSEVLHYDYGYTIPGGGGYYNGNISGIKWANASDKQARSFGYEYDNINRLKIADFNQKAGSAWNRSGGIDYSLPEMTYDANGNILRMRQSALKLNTSATVDMLTYNYLPNSNKLMRVTETAPGSTQPGEVVGLGDFKDGVNTGDDYAYDANGSLVLDNNKNIGSIVYNHLNLPQTITVTGKGTIEYIYDAGGNKLQKKTTEGTRITTTDYISGFVYNNDTLQFTGHEEGRIRYAKKYYYTGDSAYEWHYDFFYKDHLGNIRAVVTEQKDTAKYMATFETSARNTENALFANIEETAFAISNINKNGIGSSCLDCIVPETGTNYPEDNTTHPNQYTSRLNGEGKRIGAAITLKVMAGDKVDLGVKAWYPESEINGLDEPGAPEDILPSLINTLANNTAGLSGGKVTTTQLSDQASPLWVGIEAFLNSHPESEDNPEQPKAYLNWVLFDEQFNYVPAGSGFIAVPGFNPNIQTLASSNIPVVKSGYLFVYLSNETRKRDVFFDNLTVQHYTGPLSETTDYTPWGLSMKMLESKAFGRLENKKKYNGYEKNEDLGLSVYESFYRVHDPQLGRFWQADPKPSDFESLYAAMGNNPVSHSDPLGDTIIVNRQGYIIKRYGNDNLVFYQKGFWIFRAKEIIKIGELGKSINASKIFKNLLNANIAYARNHSSPFAFRNLVKNKGEWDLKNNMKTIFGLAKKFDKDIQSKTQFSFQGSNYTAEELGNFHYGATGKAWDFFLFTEDELLRNAGEAQIAAGTSKPEWQNYRTEWINAGRGEQSPKRYPLPPYGDDPHDQEMIKQGFIYYDANKKNLKIEN